MRNVIDESCRENKNTYFILGNYVFFRKSRLFLDNVEKCCGALGATNDVTIWRIRIVCWISKAKCTHAHAHARTRGHTLTHRYVIFIAIAI